MTARTGMADLITHVRLLIHDTAGTAQVFSDDELQAFLDGHQTEVRYARLTAIPSVQSGGAVEYLGYRAASGWWEGTPSLYDGSYDALTAGTANLQTGRWTFAASQSEPVYIVGYQYDVYGAAVDALTAWLSRLKFAYDFTADGASFRRSQQAAAIQGLIAQYSVIAGPQVASMTRSDLID
jgi:hypothetical protein